MKIKKTYLIIITCFLATFSYSQNKNTIDNLEKLQYNWFDSIIGQRNLDINLSPKYFNSKITLNDNHQYYSTETFQNGNVIYNEQPYFDIKLKYDIHSDELIIQLSNENQSHSLILDKSKIQGFSINNKKFIPITDKNNVNTFVEELKKGDIILYKKHFKKELIKKDERYEYSHFTDKSYYIINNQKELITIKSKKDLKKRFPSISKEINKLYRELKSSKNKDLTMINFITKIEPLFPNNHIIWTTK